MKKKLNTDKSLKATIEDIVYNEALDDILEYINDSDNYIMNDGINHTSLGAYIVLDKNDLARFIELQRK